MGKIKNDFQFWMGNNNRGVIRNGRVNINLSELGTIVEQYILTTATRLKTLEPENENSGVLPTTSLSENEKKIHNLINGNDNVDLFDIQNWPIEDFEKLKRALDI